VLVRGRLTADLSRMGRFFCRCFPQLNFCRARANLGGSNAGGTTMNKNLCLALFAASLIWGGIPTFARETVNSDLFGNLKWREIGPWRGGRVTAAKKVSGLYSSRVR
jgi:hypothetical protein